MKKVFCLLVFAATVFISACGGGGGGTATGAATATATATGVISGKVLDYSTGSGISGATVTAGSISTTTGSDGSYTLNGVAYGSRTSVNVSSSGHAEQSKIVNLSSSESNVSLSIKALPVGYQTTFNPSASQALSDPNSKAYVSVSGGSLVTSTGAQPTGSVTAKMTVVDPSGDPEVMPGDYSASGGNIESFGAMNVTFTDSSGNKMKLGSGTTSTIRIPVDKKTASPAATIPLFYYDTATGLWVQEGTAMLVGSGVNAYYEGTVTHFSTWNADKIMDRVLVKGCVKDTAGLPVSGITAKTQGVDYNGQATATSDASGLFSVYAKANATVLVSATKNGKKTNTLSIFTGSIDYDLTSSCLVLSDNTITSTLTWGSNPSDIDTHFDGPGYHIYYSNKGSLTASPYAKLDVDDRTSFGPEVLTINQFTADGCYRYNVYHYSGSSTIAASPARVELNFNGSATLFTPPAGGPSTTSSGWSWDVFDLKVTGTSVNLYTVNTWASGDRHPGTCSGTPTANYTLNTGGTAGTSGSAPTVTGMSPSTGAAGTTVIITGTNFSTTLANNTVKFNGTTATVTAATATSLTVTVPSGAATGAITVTTSGGTAASAGSFTVGAGGGGIPTAPSGVTATAGNNKLTISWSSVTGATSYNIYRSTTSGVTKSSAKVALNVTGASYSDTTAVNGITYYYAMTAVNSSGESALSNEVSAKPSATTTSVPTITSFTPTSGAVGTTVTITGTNFSTTPANNTVKFNGTAATVTAATGTSITATVPSGATTGSVSVTTAGGAATSAGSFTVPTTGTSPPITTGASYSSTLTFSRPVISVTNQNPLTYISTSTIQLYLFPGWSTIYAPMQNTSPATISFKDVLLEGLQSSDSWASGVFDGFNVLVTTSSSPLATGPRSPILSIEFTGVASTSGYESGYDPRTIGSFKPNVYTGVAEFRNYCVIGGSVGNIGSLCSDWGITVNAAAGTITFSGTPLFDVYNNQNSMGTVSGTINVQPF